jgi:hypothetical protein
MNMRSEGKPEGKDLTDSVYGRVYMSLFKFYNALYKGGNHETEWEDQSSICSEFVCCVY